MIKIILISLALIFVIIGALISALAAIGLLRLEDVYSRAHAAGKASTLGAMSLLYGTFLYFIATQGFVNMQLIVAIIFVLITGPLSSHMIMKAAYNIKTPYTKKTKVDEISEDLKDTKL
ncbi:Na(+)/H(+) antiporter subunit G1 [Staphylococcus aureus T59607]|uniref:Na+/H+ antiporter Mnh1 subunit G n=1 Tax=Staphylococcus aureus TaxID=1280 RepID=UPI00044CA054|nr:Na+/H+ antiporter Mnh1 subunit G [Staphylococcus aureus]EVU99468.1 Na(+)/H(+) antiporter subunit G1 [Staphylococcus aureus T59607]EVZ65116.1 Na(+)/H(+) antiporter subunit G1 [Staphylococcus aureus F77930]EWB34918.1 Na(+)/H(+) antiporter subunit G1 [Staphylococcus aureus W21940]EWI36097.1 Na(+)/H(+) antiporter subunit G1 [Staphylococcus aureus W50101]EWX00266.1 Na(+)/H(+) antiporter subunit G1 [Staphylococcus aureus W73676]